MTLREKAIEAAARAITETPVGDADENIATLRQVLAAFCEFAKIQWDEPAFEEHIGQIAEVVFAGILSIIAEPDEAMIEAGARAYAHGWDEPGANLHTAIAKVIPAMIRKLQEV